MPDPQSGEAVAAIVLGVLVVANTNEGLVQQAHNCRQNLLSLGPALGHVLANALADARQSLREVKNALVLVAVSVVLPVGMIAILLATTRVPAGGLDMSVFLRGDPYIAPGGGNREAADAFEGILVRYDLAAGLAVAETSTLGHTANSVIGIGGIGQS